MGRMTKKQLQQLSRDVDRIDAERRKRSLTSVGDDTLTAVQRRFAAMADAKGKQIYRGGWPDFLVVDVSGATLGVSVKEPWDSISKSQVVMFAALEAAGLAIVVWKPNQPNVLRPWRLFLSEQAAESERKDLPEKIARMKGRLERGEEDTTPPRSKQ